MSDQQQDVFPCPQPYEPSPQQRASSQVEGTSDLLVDHPSALHLFLFESKRIQIDNRQLYSERGGDELKRSSLLQAGERSPQGIVPLQNLV
jgi:hypothetical protein